MGIWIAQGPRYALRVHPLISTEARRQTVLKALDPKSQVSLGQFFTPIEAAQLMASLVCLNSVGGTLRLLDPGAGVGSLTTAIVERLYRERPEVAVHVVAVESDHFLIPHLRATLEECRDAYGITYELLESDYLVDGEAERRGPYDVVVSNPPYGKLALTTPARLKTAARAVDTPNMYSAFWAHAVESLKPGGQGVFLVPRSWASGPYYRAFRLWLLERVSLDILHVFESRTALFSDTKVKQENVIAVFTAGSQKERVRISQSVAHIEKPVSRDVQYSSLVSDGDADKVVHFGGSVTVPTAARHTLLDLGITASTGKVVDFRNRQYLTDDISAPHVAPMIYQSNIRGGAIDWPQVHARKPQGFSAADDVARRQLVPEGPYVVVKRQTAKEDRRRVIAALWDGPGAVAFDNKTNYLHASRKPLDRLLARGVMLWLNSTIVDQYFRAFSGHTQVNASDLRRLPLLDRAGLLQIAAEIPDGMPTQDHLDAILARLFPLPREVFA